MIQVPRVFNWAPNIVLTLFPVKRPVFECRVEWSIGACVFELFRICSEEKTDEIVNLAQENVNHMFKENSELLSLMQNKFETLPLQEQDLKARVSFLRERDGQHTVSILLRSDWNVDSVTRKLKGLGLVNLIADAEAAIKEMLNNFKKEENSRVEHEQKLCNAIFGNSNPDRMFRQHSSISWDECTKHFGRQVLRQWYNSRCPTFPLYPQQGIKERDERLRETLEHEFGCIRFAVEGEIVRFSNFDASVSLTLSGVDAHLANFFDTDHGIHCLFSDPIMQLRCKKNTFDRSIINAKHLQPNIPIKEYTFSCNKPAKAQILSFLSTLFDGSLQFDAGYFVEIDGQRLFLSRSSSHCVALLRAYHKAADFVVSGEAPLFSIWDLVFPWDAVSQHYRSRNEWCPIKIEISESYEIPQGKIVRRGNASVKLGTKYQSTELVGEQFFAFLRGALKQSGEVAFPKEHFVRFSLADPVPCTAWPISINRASPKAILMKIFRHSVISVFLQNSGTFEVLLETSPHVFLLLGSAANEMNAWRGGALSNCFPESDDLWQMFDEIKPLQFTIQKEGHESPEQPHQWKLIIDGNTWKSESRGFNGLKELLSIAQKHPIAFNNKKSKNKNNSKKAKELPQDIGPGGFAALIDGTVSIECVENACRIVHTNGFGNQTRVDSEIHVSLIGYLKLISESCPKAFELFRNRLLLRLSKLSGLDYCARLRMIAEALGGKYSYAATPDMRWLCVFSVPLPSLQIASKTLHTLELKSSYRSKKKDSFKYILDTFMLFLRDLKIPKVQLTETSGARVSENPKVLVPPQQIEHILRRTSQSESDVMCAKTTFMKFIAGGEECSWRFSTISGLTLQLREKDVWRAQPRESVIRSLIIGYFMFARSAAEDDRVYRAIGNDSKRWAQIDFLSAEALALSVLRRYLGTTFDKPTTESTSPGGVCFERSLALNGTLWQCSLKVLFLRSGSKPYQRTLSQAASFSSSAAADEAWNLFVSNIFGRDWKQQFLTECTTSADVDNFFFRK